MRAGAGGAAVDDGSDGDDAVGGEGANANPLQSSLHILALADTLVPVSVRSQARYRRGDQRLVVNWT